MGDKITTPVLPGYVLDLEKVLLTDEPACFTTGESEICTE